jgi:hypothetical protein
LGAELSLSLRDWKGISDVGARRAVAYIARRLTGQADVEVKDFFSTKKPTRRLIAAPCEGSR